MKTLNKEKERVLEVKDLQVSFHTYAGVCQAVRGIDFYLNKGETLAIVGESGCGKTVSSKSIMRILPSPPAVIGERSQIIYAGQDLTELSDESMRAIRGKEISMIFQDPMTSLNPTMRVGDQIAESLIIHRGMKKKEAFEHAVQMLKIVNIPNAHERARQYPHEFSGGMRQRAMIAIALACRPNILIADEPTTALDVTIQAQIMDLIKDLQNQFETAVILVTHDLGVVAEVADRVMVMYAGKVVETGTVDEIYYTPKHPYTWALLKSIPKLDSEGKEDLYALKGTPPDLVTPPEGCPFASRCAYCMKICRKNMPVYTEKSTTHSVACWLEHEMAQNSGRRKTLQKTLKGGTA